MFDLGLEVTLTVMAASRPQPDDPLWRYMDFGKFVSLVTTQSLWFGKASEFQDDPFEGYCIVSHRDPGELMRRSSLSPDEMVELISYKTGQVFQHARNHLYVNSWCQGEESMPMWQIYGAQGQGFAVKSSILRYEQAIRFDVRSGQYAFDAVQYHSNLEDVAEIQRISG